MISVAALRFSVLQLQSLHEAIMNCYFLFLGVVCALSQINVKFITRNFRFINYYWGKAFFCLFLVSMSMSNQEDTFLQYISGFFFAGLGVCFIILSIFDR